MKLTIKIIFILIALTVCSAPSFAAKRSQDVPGAESYNALNHLKSSLSGLLAENNKLEAEYKILQEKFNALELVYKSHAAEIAELKQAQAPMVISPIETKPLDEKQQQLSDGETQLLMAQSQIAHVESQLLDTDEHLRLLRLQQAELEYAKKDISLANQLADMSRKSEVKNEEQQLAELRQEYEKNLEQEKKILQEIEEMKNTNQDFDAETQQLKLENKDLESQIRHLESQQKFKEDENALLRNKKLYQVRLSENEIWQGEQQKIQLEQNISAQEAEFNSLNNQVDASLAAQSQHRQLLDSIMQVDKDNQQLKTKINELQAKIKALQ